MKKIKTSLLTLGATLIAASSLLAATAYMDPVGAVVVTCLGGPSDTRIALPFIQSPSFVGTVASVAGSDVTLTDAAFTPGEFDEVAGAAPVGHPVYYVMVNDGALEGGILDITTNTADTVTVADSTAGLVAGDTVTITKHWTFADIVGGATQTVIPDGSTVLLYDSTVAGINKGAMGVWSFYDGFGWYDPSFNAADTQVLYVGESFIVRNSGAVASGDVDLVLAGNVPMNNTRLYVMSADGNDQDNYVGMMCPVGIPTIDTGLNVDDRDKIMIPANDVVGINKGAKDIYDWYAGFNWYNNAFQVVDTTPPLPPGEGYIYRKTGQGAPATDTALGTVPYNP